MSDADYVSKADEAWHRILSMDGGQPQAIAAGMWASIYADKLLRIAAAKAKESA